MAGCGILGQVKIKNTNIEFVIFITNCVPDGSFCTDSYGIADKFVPLNPWETR